MGGSGHRARRWLRAAGVLDSPDLAPPDGHMAVEHHELASQRMQASVAWGLAVPTAPASAILLCLHGRDGSYEFAFETVAVHRFIASAGLPWAVASIDGGRASYWHRRDSGEDPQAMIFEELVPVLRDRLGPAPLLVLGWSMGGYGALLAAAEHPITVRAVAAASPALWHSFSDAAPGAFDSPADFDAHNIFRRVDQLRGVNVRIDCGEDDPFVATSRALAARLPAAESQFGEGFHDAASWRSRVPGQLAFFRNTLST